VNDELRVGSHEVLCECRRTTVQKKRLRVAADCARELRGFKAVSPCDENAMLGLHRKRRDDPSAEVAVSAENDD